MEEHISQHFSNESTITRAAWYGATSVPDVYFDGDQEAWGSAGSCQADHDRYRSPVTKLLTRSGGMSPIAIDGEFTLDGGAAYLSARFELVDSIDLGDVRAAFFLYEDDITYCCDPHGNDHWDKICRSIDYEPVAGLQNPGDSAIASAVIPLDPIWNPDNLHGVVILEAPEGPKRIIQASRLPANGIDFELTVAKRVASASACNATVSFDAQFWNLTASADQVTFAVDQGAGWPTSLQIEGDPNWYTSRTIDLAGDQRVAVTVQVQTDGNTRMGTASFTAGSANSLRTQKVALRIFNGSPAILLVDDDYDTGHSGVPYDQPFRDALDQLGYLYDGWTVRRDHGGAGPVFADEDGYDAIIWETAHETDELLDPEEIAGLETYLDAGGALYLDSMEFLSTRNGPDSFTTEYLGVSSWTVDSHANTEYGVRGDPITDGLTLPLSWPYPTANRTDTVDSTLDSRPIFFSETTLPNAVRTALPTGGRVVFSTVPQDVFSQSAPDPNNSRTVLSRILTWILQSGVADIREAAGDPGTDLRVDRNPSYGQTEIRYRLSGQASAGVVRLVVVDPAGRVIRTLVEGPSTAGAQAIYWDGRDDRGRSAPAGIYFIHLSSIMGGSSAKLVLIRG